MSVTDLPLKAWNKRLKFAGQLVRCRLCGSVQELTKAGAFRHALNCKTHTLEARYPSRELATVL